MPFKKVAGREFRINSIPHQNEVTRKQSLTTDGHVLLRCPFPRKLKQLKTCNGARLGLNRPLRLDRHGAWKSQEKGAARICTTGTMGSLTQMDPASKTCAKRLRHCPVSGRNVQLHTWLCSSQKPRSGEALAMYKKLDFVWETFQPRLHW